MFIIKKNKHIMQNDETKIRKLKINEMKKNGFSFPNNFKKDSSLKEINIKYKNKKRKVLQELNLEFSVAGRIIQKRIMGNVSFFTIQEMDDSIQLYINEKKIMYKSYNQNYKKWDIGDILATKGVLFKTKTGELSIFCKKLYILNKSLKPLPDKFHGLENQEKRYRKRYLDLISNIKLFNIFKNRFNIISTIREFMLENNFLEVETPMLQNIPGGALARPFITYHNQLNLNMYLRIAPELYLKQLIIGGFERIFELNRNFRNEGISTYHNPEFTMLEAYIAYYNYKDIIKFIEKLLHRVLNICLKKTIIPYSKHLLNFNIPFSQLKMTEAIILFNPTINHQDFDNFKKLKKIAESLNIILKEEWKIGHIINEIFEKTVEKKLIQPTFITHYPVEVSPLAKRNINNDNFTDRFELFIAGCEIANGFSELNDVEDQKNRFLNQIKNNKKENNENIFYNKDYIEALSYGLPPTAGFGIGIDRLVMILTNQTSIRDVILFPTLRPKKI